MSKKELKIKGLVAKLNKLGYKVKFQKLKQGHGWRVSSNSCILRGEKLIFIDSRLEKRDQVVILSDFLHKLADESADSEFKEAV